MDELQALWRKASVRDEKTVDQSELEAAISRRSSDELAKFRRVIKKEYRATLLVIPVITLAIIAKSEYIILFFPLALSFAALYFYWRTLAQLTQIRTNDNMQTYLLSALRFLKTYVHRYKILSWFGGISGIVFGLFLAKSSEKEINVTGSVWIDTLCVVIIVISTLLFYHFYIKHLYQARINALERLLEEFSVE